MTVISFDKLHVFEVVVCAIKVIASIPKSLLLVMIPSQTTQKQLNQNPTAFTPKQGQQVGATVTIHTSTIADIKLNETATVAADNITPKTKTMTLPVVQTKIFGRASCISNAGSLHWRSEG